MKMGEQRKIIIDNYPADRLPDDLRLRIDPTEPVRITLEQEDPHRRPPLSSYIGKGKGCYKSPEDAVDAIRALRDEWE